MPYTADQNLIIAETVVDYVRQRMTLGASNKSIDLEHAKMKHARDYKNMSFWQRLRDPGPQLTDKSVPEQRRAAPAPAQGMTPKQRIIADAQRIEQSGIGNCGEQSAVAFRYLCNVKPYADTFCYINLQRNHSCIVIGASQAQIHGTAPLGIAPPWPQAAVICDPWFNEWFRVDRDWTRKVRSILRETEPGWTQVNIDVTVIAQGP